MKKFISLFCLLLTVLVFSGCTKPQKFDNAQTLEHHVANNLENINNIQNVSDETIKALSVILRTNLMKNDNNFSNTSAKNYNEVHNKIYDISSQTKGEVLLNDNKLADVEFSDNFSQSWETEIKKSALLNFLNKNNISLSNIKTINPNFDQSGNLINIDIAGKKIDYNVLKQEFNLKSNKITNIDNNLTSLKIYGENTKPENCFYIEEAEDLAKKGSNYKELLNHFYNGFDLKTTN